MCVFLTRSCGVPLQGTLACSADTGAANCVTSVRDVLREVLKVAALSAALTIRRPGAALLAQPFPQRHYLSSVI